MSKHRVTVAGAVAILSSCGQSEQEPAATNETKPVVANTAGTAQLPPDSTPLAEPRGVIDPKSPEAAGQIVQRFGALMEKHRAPEAARMWGNAEAANRFDLQLKGYDDIHLEIGKPGEAEGAAGSIYVTVPVVFYGRAGNSTEFRRAADIILRRVNDVPGSTEAQRRWHIERIEWKNSA